MGQRGWLYVSTNFELVAFRPDLAGLPQKKLKIAYLMVGETHSFVLGTTRTNFAPELPERCSVIDYSHRDERSRTHYYTYRATDGKLISYGNFRNSSGRDPVKVRCPACASAKVQAA